MIDIRIDDLFHKDAFGIWIIKRDLQTHKSYIVQPTELVFKEYGSDTFMLPEPSFEIRKEHSVEFATALLKAYEESRLHKQRPIVTEQVSAMNENLKDLRSVVDRLFEVIKK